MQNLGLTTLVTLLIACGGDEKSEDTSSAGGTDGGADGGDGGDGGGADGGDGDGDDGGDGGGAIAGATISGKIVWDGGAPAGEGLQMRLCQELCRTTWTAADGTWTFEGIEAGTHALEAVPMGLQDSMATPLTMVTINSDDEVRALSEDLVVPAFSDWYTLDSAATRTVGRLTVATDPDAFSPADTSPSTEAYFAGVEVNPATSGLPLDGVTGAIVAMYYLGNFESHVEPAWSFSVSGLTDLPEGTVLRILVADYDNLQWADAGTATVDASGTATSGAGSGISILSTLLLVAE